MKQKKASTKYLTAIITIPIALILCLVGFVTYLARENQYDRVSFIQDSQNNKVDFNQEYVNMNIKDNKEAKLKLEIASTTQDRMNGLMYRTSLEEDGGMLFIFEEESNLQFWMKNTYIPLDIAFLDKDFKVVTIHKNTLPQNTNIKYSSQEPAMYAIETNAGWMELNQVKTGDHFIIDQN